MPKEEVVDVRRDRAREDASSAFRAWIHAQVPAGRGEQGRAAARLHVDQEQISRWKKGQQPRLDSLAILSEFTGTPIDQMAGRTNAGDEAALLAAIDRLPRSSLRRIHNAIVDALIGAPSDELRTAEEMVRPSIPPPEHAKRDSQKKNDRGSSPLTKRDRNKGGGR